MRFDYHNAYVPAQDAAGDPVRGGAPLRRDLQRAELEGPLAASRRDLRPLRQRQDRAARQLGPVPGERIDQHGDAEQPGQHLGEQRERAAGPTPTATSCPTATSQNPGAQLARVRRLLQRAARTLGSLAISAALRSDDHVRIRRSPQRPGNRHRRPAGDRCRSLSVDFQFTHHCVRQLRRQPEHDRAPPSAYDPFCVTPPTAASNGFTLPNGRAQICGFVDPQPEPSPSRCRSSNVKKASNFGDVSDVYTGYDVNLNARLPRGGIGVGRCQHRSRSDRYLRRRRRGERHICGGRRRAGIEFRHAPRPTARQRGRIQARCIATSSRRSSPTSRDWSAIRCRGGASEPARRCRIVPVRRFWRTTP